MKKNTILIVEDVLINRMMLAEIFNDEYEILEAENGEEGLKLLTENFSSIVAVLLDIVMPVMDGFQVLEELNRQNLISKVPIIMITGENSVEYERRGYEYGVVDYIHKPYYAPVVKQMIKNNINLYAYKADLESLVKIQTAELQEQNKLLKEQAEKLRKTNDVMIDAMSNVVEFRNMESGQHVKRIRVFTKALAEEIMKRFPEYELTPHKIEIINQAAAMHDIGKITVPDNILLKPGRLTAEEFEVMKAHTSRGSEMIATFVHLEDEEYYNYCYDICRYHHERWDGRGYPDGLKGEEIPLSSRIVAIADTYDAMTSTRSYRTALPHEVAIDEIKKCAGSQFDPNLATKFIELEAIIKEAKENPEKYYSKYSYLQKESNLRIV